MEVSDMNNDDNVNDVESDTTSTPEDRTVPPSSPRTKEQEAEELRRKIAEIERKVADGN
jgi:hypothetical protein